MLVSYVVAQACVCCLGEEARRPRDVLNLCAQYLVGRVPYLQQQEGARPGCCADLARFGKNLVVMTLAIVLMNIVISVTMAVTHLSFAVLIYVDKNSEAHSWFEAVLVTGVAFPLARVFIRGFNLSIGLAIIERELEQSGHAAQIVSVMSMWIVNQELFVGVASLALMVRSCFVNASAGVYIGSLLLNAGIEVASALAEMYMCDRYGDSISAAKGVAALVLRTSRRRCSRGGGDCGCCCGRSSCGGTGAAAGHIVDRPVSGDGVSGNGVSGGDGQDNGRVPSTRRPRLLSPSDSMYQLGWRRRLDGEDRGEKICALVSPFVAALLVMQEEHSLVSTGANIVLWACLYAGVNLFVSTMTSAMKESLARRLFRLLVDRRGVELDEVIHAALAVVYSSAAYAIATLIAMRL
jgi:hypothetical protein